MILQTYMPGFEPAAPPPVVEKPAPAAPAKKGTVPRRAMTPDEQQVVQCLKGVRTPPACWDKRFIRDVGFGGLITEKEAAQTWRLFHKYRRQIKTPNLQRLLEIAVQLAAPDLRKKA